MFRVVGAYVGMRGDRFDLDYYLSEHVAKAHALLDPFGLTSVRVLSGFEPPADGAAGLVAMIEMEFATGDGFRTGLATNGAALFDDLKNFTDLTPMLQVCSRLDQL